ncbi:piggyBac transposable element-derived protein 4-like [Homalodisca vitripennis]|uniref:piggyBac transposable element-derived protein 4-like n=2 Tax=Homalodisca vitripennis TaxID=197043 RepID=UPI001EEB91CC|nr:piggyBac transposable element-derived protein 4-like [Homalodisca vitripennis]
MSHSPGTSREIPAGDSDLDSDATGYSDDSDLDAAQAHQEPLPDDHDSDNDDVEYNYDFDWSPNTIGMRNIPFTKENKILIPTPGNNEPIDWFSVLFDDVLLEKICSYTNAYAWTVFELPTLTPKSRINKWVDLTVPELKTFIGVLLHMGTVRTNRLSDYWNKHRFFNFEAIREQMSRDRWLLIMRCLHFSKNAQVNVNEQNDNRLEKVDLLISTFNSVMSTVYYPGKELSIDESMMLWRGRLLFRQYIKNKKHKYGIKFYSLCEPDGLCIRFTIYSGKGGELSGVGHTNKVVMHLMRHRLGVGHSLYMDNYYNSVPLAATLLRESTYCTGTLRADRKYLPEEVKTAVLKKGETVARYAQGIAVAKWKDKRTVLYISTEFENEMAVSHNRYGQPRQKPLAIIHYNAEMSGVDRHDQLMAYYPAEHKSLRWYKKVFVHILQMGFINAFRLYKKSNPATKKSLYDFRIDLVHALLPPKERLLLRPVQRNQNRHVISKIPKLPNKARVSRRRCKQCQTEGRETRTIYFCAQCDGEPGLCALACFDKWHA